jgi:hypothetical protein
VTSHLLRLCSEACAALCNTYIQGLAVSAVVRDGYPNACIASCAVCLTVFAAHYNNYELHLLCTDTLLACAALLLIVVITS